MCPSYIYIMPERNLSGNAQIVGGGSYIAGDSNPANFSYSNKISSSELLSLLLRNPKIQKATVWFAGEMLRERWEFKSPQSIMGIKHGLDYMFPEFNEWLEWNGFMQEVLKAFFWSLLFGESIMIFYDGNESTAERYQNGKHGYLNAVENYTSCRAYYPQTNGNGYNIQDVDPLFGNPQTYKLHLHAHKAEHSVTYYVDTSRVVRFSAPQKELKFNGTSNVSAIVHDCIVQEQIKRAVATQANNLQGGIVAVKASTEEERAIIDGQIGDTLTHLRRVYYKNIEEKDGLVNLIIPDLKIDQLEKLNKIIQTDIATGMDMSISILEGSPQGAISSAGFDTVNTYAKVKQLQSHYKRAMEECFWKFGKTDTSFDWIDPTPTAEDTSGGLDTPRAEGEKDEDEDKVDEEDTNIEEEEEDV